ncbi:MAG: response regulator [Pseudobdellovibrionaceae bacterium]
MNKILCVEDTTDIRLILESILGNHHLTFASSMRETEEILNQDTFPLIILDVDLPDGNALELMAAKPDFFKNSAVIFLTGKKDFSTKVTAITLRSDDFILKPLDSNDQR